MNNVSNMTDEEVRRLSWRCRRGLLELDIILQRFSENHLASVSKAELAAFDRLLDLPDNEFIDVITERVALQASEYVGRALARHVGLKHDLHIAELDIAPRIDLVAMQKVLEKLREN